MRAKKPLLHEQREADVAVIGAGLAGVAAAITAARQGARVLLLEQENGPGGTAAGLRHPFLCGLFPNSETEPKTFLNSGLTEEFCAHLSPGGRPVRRGRVWLWPCGSTGVRTTAARLLKRESSLAVWFNARVLDCRRREGKVRSLEVQRRGQFVRITAPVFIDASAGVVIRRGGAIQTAGPDLPQLSGYGLELDGVDWEEGLPIQVPYLLNAAVANRELPLPARWTFVTSAKPESRVHLKLSLPAGADLTAARDHAAAILKVLRRDLPAFRQAKVRWQAQRVFARSGEQLQGRYQLKTRDVLECRRFPDRVVKGAWPIEFWDPDRGPRYQYPGGEHYDVPARCLAARSFGNLFAAGRCVSADPGAQASLRAGGLCLALGEAAGEAAVACLSSSGAGRA